MNIITYSQSPEFYPADLCGGHVPSFVATSPILSRENCWAYYQWMSTIVLIFFITFHYYTFFLVFWSFGLNSLFYQKTESWYFYQWPSVMPKQEKTRNVMRQNNSDDLPNITFVMTIPIIWEVYLESIQTSVMEVFGKIAVSWLLFLQ